MIDTAAWKTLLTLGTGVALAAGIAYAFLGSGSGGDGDGPKRRAVARSRPRPPAAAPPRPAAPGGSDDDDDIADASKLRGYKQTKTGQTTTYFNRELSEKDKALLGDSTPKRIDPGAPAASTGPVRLSPAASSPPASSSAWNAAGTWEERDVTPWASARLREMIRGLRVEAGGNEIAVSRVKSVDGDAAIAVARGKRKNIYDINVELDWTLSSAGAVLASGSASVGDITWAREHEVVCRCNGQSSMSSSLKNTVAEMALAKHSKFKMELNKILDQFAADFEAKNI